LRGDWRPTKHQLRSRFNRASVVSPK
jgi:hypothetical protein